MASKARTYVLCQLVSVYKSLKVLNSPISISMAAIASLTSVRASISMQISMNLAWSIQDINGLDGGPYFCACQYECTFHSEFDETLLEAQGLLKPVLSL